MGNKNSKDQKGKDLKEIGSNANKEDPDTFCSYTPINLSNEVIVGQSKSNSDDDYKKIKFLGEGAFATVYEVQNKYTGTVCAMKVIKKSFSTSREDEQEILNEINILRTMDHPNILKIFEFYSNKESYSIVTEICKEGELFQNIIDNGPFDEKYTAYVMYQIFSAINYCHSLNIIHRDLKPENILIISKEKNDYPNIKICDFGTAKICEKGKSEKTFVGSSYYIAPEVLKRNYNLKCDLWSCGVIMYILLSARPPFNGKDDYDIMNNVANGHYDLTKKPFDKVSDSAKDLIKKLLERNVSKRVSAQEALNHPWFKENKAKELYNKIKDKNTIKKMIENLKKYKRESVIQETALAYIIHNFPQYKDVINACKLFNQIDTSGDGKITQDELYKGIAAKYKSDTLKEDVEAIYKKLDMDNNGYIGYEEFVRAAVSKEYFVRDKVLQFAFRYFDKDNSKSITFSEIEDLFAESITDKANIHSYLNQILKEVDVNGDGKITFDEFAAVMKRMLK